MENNIVEQAIVGYTKQRRLYTEFSARLSILLHDLIYAKNIDIHTIEHRTKSIDSFKQKLQDPGKSYIDPLKEVSDLSGVRIILYYPEDVTSVCNVVEHEFRIDPQRSVDKGASLSIDQFGYLSKHYVVSLKANRAELPEWAQFKNLVAEIQIRTVLQHAWAAISHKLQYKHESEIPVQFRRRLVRLSSLLELADDQFETLRKEQAQSVKSITAKLKQNDLDVQSNLVSLSEYIKTSTIVKDIVNTFNKSGFHTVVDKEGATQITSIAHSLGLTTVASVDSALRLQAASLRPLVEGFKKQSMKRGIQPHNVIGSPDHWGAMTLAWSRMDDFKKSTNIWGKDYRQDMEASLSLEP